MPCFVISVVRLESQATSISKTSFNTEWVDYNIHVRSKQIQAIGETRTETVKNLSGTVPRVKILNK